MLHLTMPLMILGYLMFVAIQMNMEMNCIHSKDKEAAKETINKAESSSKYTDKMNNAIATYRPGLLGSGVFDDVFDNFFPLII